MLFGSSPRLADGAMGTELLWHGIPADSCLEAVTVERPALVASIHRAFRDAGSEVLTTNTFGANRYRLARHGLAHRTIDFNRAAAQLARSVADASLIAGSIGPSGEHGCRPPDDELCAAFREQASALAYGGVDLFLCETFGDATELRTAVCGIREVSNLPIIASMAYGTDGRTLTGAEPSAVVESLRDLDIAAIGANCCVGHATSEHVIDALRDLTSLPLVACPNAGQPELIDGTWRYPVGPDEFADLVVRLSSTAQLLGGCCGTTPDHIAAARARLKPTTLR